MDGYNVVQWQCYMAVLVSTLALALTETQELSTWGTLLKLFIETVLNIFPLRKVRFDSLGIFSEPYSIEITFNLFQSSHLH